MLRPLLALSALILLVGTAHSQPIARPYPFDIVPLDTTSSAYLDALISPAHELTTSDRLKSGRDGHLVDQTNKRVRLFGTSLMYTSQFLPQDDAKMLAVRLRKLGFNAVRLIYNDFFGWDDASLMKTYTDDWTAIRPSSYDINAAQLARFDTLLYEFKRNGIYTVLTLNSYHNYSFGDGVTNWDSTFAGGSLHHFWDTTAQRLQKQWATTLLGHTNPLTGIPLKSDPMIAYVSFNYEQSLYYWWYADKLNYTDEANKLNAGKATIAYRESRKLDTLFNRYLQKKYGTQNALRQAWGGDQNPPKTNLIDNGSFENFSSQAWTFAAANGANAGQVEGDGGVDSSVFAKIRVNKLSPNPVYNDIVIYNLSPRLGMDTLYELSFWAKMGYDGAKRPGITQRSLGALVFSYATSAVGLNTSIVIDTAWKKYSFTFRTTGSGIHYVYLYFGTDLGDIWLDAFDLHRKADTPLLQSEDLAKFTIDRLQQSALANYPRPRARDMVMFYDSLERGFYQSMQLHLKNNGYAGLVNWTQTQWYSMLPDIYKASGGDIAEHHTGWDYISQRPDMIWSDSTWMVRNTSMVRSLSGGTLNNISANLVAGKANILGDYQVPWMNQYTSEHLVLIPALASYQDLDGIFFTPFSVFREDLRATRLPNQFLNEGGFTGIGKNPAILSLLPSASYTFRNNLIKPAEVEDTLQHDMNDVWLYPVQGANRGYHGVEGYLDPNAATAFRMRQSFGAKVHKIAAEYPYLSDTAVKKFDQGEIEWDQTNGAFSVLGGNKSDGSFRVRANTGFYVPEMIGLMDGRITRTDKAGDILSFYHFDLGNKFEDYDQLLTISTRSQNSNQTWAKDSLSFTKDFGTAPTVMSAATLELSFPEPATQGWRTVIYVQPMDSHGIPMGAPFKSFNPLVIDQAVYKTTWFALKAVATPFTDDVADKRSPTSLYLYPNPAMATTTLFSNEELKAITIFNALGQSVDMFETKGTSAILDVSSLAPGAYTLIVETANGRRILPLRKL